MNIDTLFTLSYLKLPIKEFLLMFLTSFNDNSAVEVDERETNVAFIAISKSTALQARCRFTLILGYEF